MAVLAYGMTGGNALNDYNTTNGFLFVTAPGCNGVNNDVTNYFELTTNGTWDRSLAKRISLQSHRYKSIHKLVGYIQTE